VPPGALNSAAFGLERVEQIQRGAAFVWKMPGRANQTAGRRQDAAAELALEYRRRRGNMRFPTLPFLTMACPICYTMPFPIAFTMGESGGSFDRNEGSLCPS
jgi:hypothetical protein